MKYISENTNENQKAPKAKPNTITITQVVWIYALTFLLMIIYLAIANKEK